MSIVNAEVNELLQYWNNVKIAIKSIETTESSIMKKYQQLAAVWKDKKYKELGQVVQECSKALNETLKILSQGEKFISVLVKNLQEYDSIRLEHLSNHAKMENGMGELSRTLGFNGRQHFLNRNQIIHKALKGVEYKPIEPATSVRSEQQIINSISGGDMTEGSCSSLAFAYAGNRAGYIVYDFRDGLSRDFFSLRSTIEAIANIDGVISTIINGTNDTLCAEQLISNLELGREYYMATGAHAAVVRLTNDGVQYLELQSGIPSENGWHLLTRNELRMRFGCEDVQSVECSNYLIELDSLQNNAEFLDILGYINTDESAQRRGESGYVR